MRKDAPFEFGESQIAAMDDLKDDLVKSNVLWPEYTDTTRDIRRGLQDNLKEDRCGCLRALYLFVLFALVLRCEEEQRILINRTVSRAP
jgi:hypothetical protein